MTPSDGDDDAYAEKDIDVDLVQVGDLLKVLPGAKVPTDGVVVRGEAFINESMVTGETMPVTKKVDGQVMSGSINEGNAFVMRAEKIGADSALYQIVRLVEEAQLVKAPIQAFADRVSNIFVPLVVTMAAITFCSWLIAGWAHSIPDTWIPENENRALFAMMFGISVLVTACPCALGLATPTAIMVGTSVAATNGIVIKGGDALDVIQTDCGPIGVLICYDSEFPELARRLVDQGARIIFVPFCTDSRAGYMRVRYCAQARAIENQCYVVMSGNVGNLPNVDNMDIQYAQSAILTPCDLPFARDGIAAESSENVETLTMADVNLADLSWARAEGTVRNLRDRRFDLYHIEWDNNPDHAHAQSGGSVPAGGHNSPGGG